MSCEILGKSLYLYKTQGKLQLHGGRNAYLIRSLQN